MRMFLRAVTALVAAGLIAQAGGPHQFEKLGTFRATGLAVIKAESVGPGPGGKGQRLYVSYLYTRNTVDVISVDPDTGEFELYPNPVPTETAARVMVTGPDGKIYLGTQSTSRFYCVDPLQNKLLDLGRPSSTEEGIWGVAFGSDGKLYGGTYPGSKLVRYDPKTGRLDDLGRMDPVENYAAPIAASDDGFVYAAIGTSRADVAAFETSTGEHREILPDRAHPAGSASVQRGRDGKVYAQAGNEWFRLEGWNAIPVAKSDVPPAVAENVLKDGRIAVVASNSVRVTDPRTGAATEHAFDYRGNDLELYRLTLGPGGSIYASTILPAYLVRFDLGSGKFDNLGRIGGGEVYSILNHGGHVLMAGYSTIAPLMVFDPSQPFHEKPFAAYGDLYPREGETAQEKPYDTSYNPALVHFAGQDHGWRPMAQIEGPDGRIYIGAISGYGKLGGPFTIWNPETGAVEDHEQIVKDESVASLAATGKLIVGGATIRGGGGSHPTQKDAKLLLWDNRANQEIFETVPVPGASGITDLTAVKGHVFGIADRTLFVFDVARRRVIHSAPLDFGVVYNSMALGPDGKIWGLATTGIFQIDPQTYHAALVATSPVPILSGFAMDATGIYFASHASLYRYAFR